MFGELGLLNKAPRSATIIARTDSLFAILDTESYKDILEAAEIKKLNDRIDFFQHHMLSGCGRQVISKFSYNFKKFKYIRNTVIYSEGDKSNTVYLIKKGSV